MFSAVSSPRPIAFDGGDHAAVPPEDLVADRDDARVRIGEAGGGAHPERDIGLVAFRLQRAERDEGGRGRPADAGIAMDDDRADGLPAGDEVDELLDVLPGREHHAVERLDDVVDAEEEVVLLR